MIYQQTDGNPLFAIELIKVLMEESAGAEIAAMPARIPAGVHETIGRRLIRLSDRCNELLCIAAVYGRQFTAREIAAATDEDVQCVLTDLEPAMQAGIVQSDRDAPGGYQFTHALIRETIYEDLPTVDRLRLHGRAGDALVSVHSAHLEPALTRIANHYHQAAALGDHRQSGCFTHCWPPKVPFGCTPTRMRFCTTTAPSRRWTAAVWCTMSASLEHIFSRARR